MKEFTIGPNDSNQRLDRYLAKAVPRLPSSLLQKYIRIKRIKVNGRGAKREYKLLSGDRLQLYIEDAFFEAVSGEDAYLTISTPRLDILYEDENILLADKKPGVLCHSAEGESKNTLIDHIKAHLYKSGQWNPAAEASFSPALANRIDRNTGGIVIAAKNAESLRILNEKIKNRELDKRYLCIVHGRPEPPAGSLSGYLFKDAEKNQVYVRETSEKGTKTAVTQYKTLETRGNLSLLECKLITGRTHQIRAQLAHAGHPLLGDGKYGSEAKNRPYGEKHQALYAYKLKFAFISGTGLLDYLNWQSFEVPRVDFFEKYFAK